MISVLVSEEATSDAEQILSYLYREASPWIAEHYERRFLATLEQLKDYPESGAPRPSLGANCRVAIVSPYVLIYDFVREESVLILLRILHGRRDIHERLLRR